MSEPNVMVTVFPNPSNGTMVLQLAAPLAMEGTLSVFNLDGKRLVNEKLAAGSRGKVIDLTKFPAGIYFCEIREGAFSVLSSRVVVVW